MTTNQVVDNWRHLPRNAVRKVRYKKLTQIMFFMLFYDDEISFLFLHNRIESLWSNFIYESSSLTSADAEMHNLGECLISLYLFVNQITKECRSIICRGALIWCVSRTGPANRLIYLKWHFFYEPTALLLPADPRFHVFFRLLLQESHHLPAFTPKELQPTKIAKLYDEADVAISSVLDHFCEGQNRFCDNVFT